MSAGPALQQYLSETSAHGISRLTGQRPLHVRLFWAVSFLALLVIFSISFVWSIQRFEQRGSKTTVFTEHVEFVFPDLYVCSMNPISGSFSLQLSSNESRAINASINEILGKIPNYLLSSFSMLPLIFKFVMNSMSYQKTADLLGHRMSQMVLSSEITQSGSYLDWLFLNKKQKAEVLEFYHPEHLRCVRISLNDTQRRLLAHAGQNLRLVMVADTFIPEFPIDSHQLYCTYLQFADEPQIPVYPPMWNFADGWNVYGKSGLRLFLVEPNTFPAPWSTNVLLKAGTNTEVKISMEQIEVDEREFGDSCVPKSRVNEVEFHNPYSTDEPYKFKYSYAYCYYKEVTRLTQQLQNCTAWNHPMPASFAHLLNCFNISELSLQEFFTRLNNIITMSAVQNSVTQEAARICSKQLSCSRTTYQLQTSQIDWITEKNIDTVMFYGFPQHQYEALFAGTLPRIAPMSAFLANQFSLAMQNTSTLTMSDITRIVESQVLQVRLFGEGQNSTLVQVTLDYTLLNLFAETGGFLGLYLGCSVLTLAELLELLHNLLHLMVCKRLARRFETRQKESGEQTVTRVVPFE